MSDQHERSSVRRQPVDLRGEPQRILADAVARADLHDVDGESRAARGRRDIRERVDARIARGEKAGHEEDPVAIRRGGRRRGRRHLARKAVEPPRARVAGHAGARAQRGAVGAAQVGGAREPFGQFRGNVAIWQDRERAPGERDQRRQHACAARLEVEHRARIQRRASDSARRRRASSDARAVARRAALARRQARSPQSRCAATHRIAGICQRRRACIARTSGPRT